MHYYFGLWRFNANSGNLSDEVSTTRLEPQVAKLLAYFFAHQNTLTSRDELIADVWENRSVSDDAINSCISILRQILTPDDKNKFIETTVRRGFVSHFYPGVLGSKHRQQRLCGRGRKVDEIAVVDCIRTGLVRPSYVTPYLEPFLSYYDSIRDEPEFVELLGEIQ